MLAIIKLHFETKNFHQGVIRFPLFFNIHFKLLAVNDPCQINSSIGSMLRRPSKETEHAWIGDSWVGQMAITQFQR